MQTNRAPSPFRAPSPYRYSADPQYSVLPSLPTGPAKVGPGHITYTTSTGPDGRITYEPYRAVAASYRTPSGVVSGIQWVKADPTSIIPPGAQPYMSGGAGNWKPTLVPPQHEWQRAEDKRRKHEEKAETNHIRELDERDEELYEFRMVHERDVKLSGNRDRRKSFNGPQAAPAVAFPSMSGGTGYPIHPSQLPGYPNNQHAGVHGTSSVPGYPSGVSGHSRNSSASGGVYGDLAQQFSNLDMGRQQDYERDRKISNPKRSRKYSSNDGGHERARTISGNYVDRNAYQPAPVGVYPSASEPYNISQNLSANHHPSASYIIPSPNMRTGEISYGNTGISGYPTSNHSGSAYNSSPAANVINIARSTTPFGNSGAQVYSRGHILEGQPIAKTTSNPRSRAPSRASSPNPLNYGHGDTSLNGKSPRVPAAAIPGEQLPAPEAFSRPINGSNSFPPFEMLKIVDMEDLYDTKLPKMPGVLSSHDIYQEDWKRCMQDLGRSWTGQLPVAFGMEGQPRRSTLAVDLINLWNNSFFFNRGVELMLYRGRERRTGPQTGYIDTRLPLYDDDESSSLDSSSNSECDYNRASGPYGRLGRNQTAELQEVKRRRYEEKEDRRRRKARRKAKARDKTYVVYIGSSTRGPPPPSGYAAGAQIVPGDYGPGVASTSAAGYNPSMAGYIPPAVYTPSSGYGHPIGVPKTSSHGYGGNY
ncbi:hypothetical protein HYPSUDRAFT_200456 [Hypholoma sublateritium FD-334 SS-4]|uniref:Uncharacterized protein n=1 Tax=Hypholoma sublateritium (strain FD-334 SS-4) TaxID=945553 RepID=A0A0D2ML85_HYPSF|nr:hypothetical protein HYPSUDRAFT_200456 [Hypholoma sublateritium FD-334 SS-4]